MAAQADSLVYRRGLREVGANREEGTACTTEQA